MGGHRLSFGRWDAVLGLGVPADTPSDAVTWDELSCVVVGEPPARAKVGAALALSRSSWTGAMIPSNTPVTLEVGGVALQLVDVEDLFALNVYSRTHVMHIIVVDAGEPQLLERLLRWARRLAYPRKVGFVVGLVLNARLIERAFLSTMCALVRPSLVSLDFVEDAQPANVYRSLSVLFAERKYPILCPTVPPAYLQMHALLVRLRATRPIISLIALKQAAFGLRADFAEMLRFFHERARITYTLSNALVSSHVVLDCAFLYSKFEKCRAVGFLSGLAPCADLGALWSTKVSPVSCRVKRGAGA